MEDELMKRKLLGSLVIAGTVIISASFGAYAATNLEEISAYLNTGIGIKLNGESWQAKDPDGKALYPITYEGSTYLPVRAVGEAFGVKIDYDGATNTVLLGGASAVPVEAGTAGKSRSNPAAIGTKVNFEVKDFIEEYKGSLSVTQVIRGAEAWKLVSAANQFNSAAKDGYEYILVKINIQIDNNKNNDAKVSVSSVDFTAVSTAGQDYEMTMVVEPQPSINAGLYVGASHTGWVAYQVKKDDASPLIAFGRNYDGTGGFWFKTN